MKTYKLESLSPEEVKYLKKVRGLTHVYAYDSRLLVDDETKAIEFLILDDILSH